MIRITDQEKIKTKGDFKLDGLLIKKHYFDKQTSGAGKESLVIEAAPFTRLDDGTVIYAPDRVYKIISNDLIADLSNGRFSQDCVQAMMEAYFATEKATQMMMNELQVACGWEAPQ